MLFLDSSWRLLQYRMAKARQWQIAWLKHWTSTDCWRKLKQLCLTLLLAIPEYGRGVYFSLRRSFSELFFGWPADITPRSSSSNMQTLKFVDQLQGQKTFSLSSLRRNSTWSILHIWKAGSGQQILIGATKEQKMSWNGRICTCLKARGPEKITVRWWSWRWVDLYLS